MNISAKFVSYGQNGHLKNNYQFSITDQVWSEKFLRSRDQLLFAHNSFLCAQKSVQQYWNFKCLVYNKLYCFCDIHENCWLSSNTYYDCTDVIMHTFIPIISKWYSVARAHWMTYLIDFLHINGFNIDFVAAFNTQNNVYK